MIDAFSVADAVAELILSGAYNLPISAEVRIPRTIRPDEIKGFQVLVLPTTEDVENETRTSSLDRVTVDVGMQMMLEDDTDGNVRELHAICQQIRAQMERQLVTDAQGQAWRCVSLSFDPVFSHDHIVEFQLFTSVLSTVWRAAG